MTIWPGYRLRLSLGRPRAASVPRRVWLAAAAAAAIALVALPAVPAAASGNPGNLSVSVSVVSSAVKSVTLSATTDNYAPCSGGSSTPTQLGFPNGDCQGANPITVTNGTASATIMVNGADMVPADNVTSWTLAGTPGQLYPNGCAVTGANQYCETLSKAAGYNYPNSPGVPMVQLGNTATCDDNWGPSSCAATPGQAVTEYLAMEGPSSSTDTSSSFTTTVTWTAT